MSTQKILTINPEAFKFPGKKKTLKERKIKPLQNANQGSWQHKTSRRTRHGDPQDRPAGNIKKQN